MSLRLVVGFFICLLVFGNSYAKESRDIVYIDVEYIVSKSTAAQQVKKVMQAEVDKFQTSMKEKQEIISKQENELKSKVQVLSPEVLKNEKEKIVRQFQAFEAELAQKKQNMDQNYTNLLSEIQSHVQKIVIEIAEKNDYKVVVTKSSLVYAAQSLNISEDVILLLNKRVPSIDINIKQ